MFQSWDTGNLGQFGVSDLPEYYSQEAFFSHSLAEEHLRSWQGAV